jgi:hypothetical protein
MVQGLLAPTDKQRLKYQHWLHVYAKSRSKVTPRQAILVDEYIVRILINVFADLINSFLHLSGSCGRQVKPIH